MSLSSNSSTFTKSLFMISSGLFKRFKISLESSRRGGEGTLFIDSSISFFISTFHASCSDLTASILPNFVTLPTVGLLTSVGGLELINGQKSADSGGALCNLESDAGAWGWGDNGRKLKNVGVLDREKYAGGGGNGGAVGSKKFDGRGDGSGILLLPLL